MSVADGSSTSTVGEYRRTLDDYAQFDINMATVSDDWQSCKQLIEAYNEQQVSLLYVWYCILYLKQWGCRGYLGTPG